MNHLKQGLVILALIAIGLSAGWSAQERITPRPQAPEILRLSPDAAALITTDTPILLSLSTCPACRQARQWLLEQEVVFDERAIDQTDSAHAMAEALGIKAVPALIVGDRYLIGFHVGKMREILALQR